jgi:hypothetical protein
MHNKNACPYSLGRIGLITEMMELMLTHGLRSFQVMMDMQSKRCMLKKFHVEEPCEDSIRRTKPHN